MKRRSFLQAMLGLFSLPVVAAAATEKSEPSVLVGFDLGKPGGDFTAMAAGFVDPETGEIHYLMHVTPHAAELLRGDQWLPEQIVRLKGRHRTPHVINKIKPQRPAGQASQRLRKYLTK